jgi:SNF2 family DNA or RNA helicase
MNKKYEQIIQAIDSLLTVCDGASTRDNQGFNGYDASFMRDIRYKEWSPKTARAAWRSLRKYRTQLSNHGIDYDSILEPKVEVNNKEKTTKEITFESMLESITWSESKVVQTKNNGLMNVQKAEIPEGFWGYWKIRKEEIKAKNISVSKYNGDWQLALWSEYTEPKIEKTDLDLSSEINLYPFQKEGVEFIESKNGRVLIGDEMGLGKTVQALSWLKIHPELRPAIVVVPASLKINWMKESKIWLNNKEKITIINGKKAQEIKGDIIIINYDILSSHRETLENINPKVMVIDEIHKIKNRKAKRTKTVKILGKNIDSIIGLSGTPIVNRPIEIFNALNLIRPELFNSFWNFAQNYCNPTHTRWGWNFNGATNTEELHQLLTDTLMIRRLKKDVLKELPEKQRTVIPLEITNRTEYNYAEENLIDYIRETEGREKADKATNAEHLVEFEKLKQLAVKGKWNQVINWIEDFLESGEKLVVFATHHKVIDDLMGKFSDIAVKLDGRDSDIKRDKAVESFQNNDKIKLFIGNIKAAGEGITLTASSNVVFIEEGWTPGEHNQAEDRIHRIGQENACNIYYLVAENTIEEEICGLLDKKRKVLDSVLDGKDTEDNNLLKELMNKYKGE